MHQAVKDYIKKIKEKIPEHFIGKKVLEMGSMNYNGTPRDMFDDCEYTGIDHMSGDGVDIVCKAHEFNGGLYDTIISTEMLEHDKYAELSLKNAYKLLKPGGLLLCTAAGENREKHHEFTGEDEHYMNISKKFIKKIFPKAEIEETPCKTEIRFICKKPL